MMNETTNRARIRGSLAGNALRLPVFLLTGVMAGPGAFLTFPAGGQEAGEAPAAAHAEAAAPLDPAAWGEDAGDAPLPEYVTGDQCLFCHRHDIGPTWDANPHARTIRFPRAEEPALDALRDDAATAELAEQVQYLLGRQQRVRYLRESGSYGRLDLAGVQFVPPLARQDEALINKAEGWNPETFAVSCAGCHATAVEEEPPVFAAFSLDCYSCHGAITLDHTNDTSLMLLSKKREDPARVIASACGQCHLRGGHSERTGRPYPDRFVSGNNLFKDYRVDFSDDYLAALNPDDRHIYRNVRDIVVNDETAVTCLSCHSVHAETAAPHKQVPRSAICLDCHPAADEEGTTLQYERSNAVCGY